MLGAWISGGVEWNVFHHHRATSQYPIDYKLVDNGDGSKTIWVGEVENRHRMSWAIGLTLHPDKSYIEVTGRFFNNAQDRNSMLHWNTSRLTSMRITRSSSRRIPTSAPTTTRTVSCAGR